MTSQYKAIDLEHQIYQNHFVYRALFTLICVSLLSDHYYCPHPIILCAIKGLYKLE